MVISSYINQTFSTSMFIIAMTIKRHVHSIVYCMLAVSFVAVNSVYMAVANTLIESSNRSVLKITLLKNYIFLTNEFFSTKYKDKFISIFYVYS